MSAVASSIVAVILLAAQAASTETSDQGTNVYRADFEADADINFDGRPDGWVRKRGPGFPHFAKAEIVERPDAPSGKRCLRMDLDGGAVSISSPSFALNSRFSFYLEGKVQTEQLVHTAAVARLTLIDDEGRTVMSLATPMHRENAGWTPLRIGPIYPPPDANLRGIITLEAIAVDKQSDLRGAVWFDDLRVARLPRMTLATNADVNVFTSLSAPEVTCEASGISADQPTVEFRLYDAADQVLAEHSTSMKEIRGGKREETAPGQVFSGRATWKPPLKDYGFYRIRVMMRDQQASWLARETTFAVIRPGESPIGGDLGWSLPAGELPLAPGPLAQLLTHSGVNWVKCPVWFNADDVARADRIAWFAERLSMHRIELIGVLDQPPPELRQVFRERGELSVASVFIDPDVWQPVVDPVMTRLSLKVRWWQLGSDRDSSFVGFPQIKEKIAEIKQHLERFGQDLRLGVQWNWLNAPPTGSSADKIPWRFLTYRSDPDLTAEELGEYLAAMPRDGTRNWVQLEPLPRGSYALSVRIQDLIHRLIAAKMHRADAVFITRPFHDEQGLMNADGTPGELFLPWRTTALQLAGTTYLGKFQLAGGSTNFVFAKDGKATIVAWNAAKVRETFFLGENVRGVDVWGKEISVTNTSADGIPTHEFEVGPEPIFLTGLDEHIARWRLSIAFSDKRLESIFGREQRLTVTAVNPFPQAISGEVTVHAPATWEYPKQPLRFRVGEGENLKLSIPIVLSHDTPSGPQPIRLDFRLSGQAAYHFSVHRTVQVGLEDVALTMVTRNDGDGDLQVELQFQNLTERFVSFNCTLFPPGRRRITAQAVDLPPGRTVIKVPIQNAADLVGQRISLRAEEMGGPRVLNHSAVVEH